MTLVEGFIYCFYWRTAVFNPFLMSLAPYRLQYLCFLFEKQGYSFIKNEGQWIIKATLMLEKSNQINRIKKMIYKTSISPWICPAISLSFGWMVFLKEFNTKTSHEHKRLWINSWGELWRGWPQNELTSLGCFRLHTWKTTAITHTHMYSPLLYVHSALLLDWIGNLKM